MIGSRIVKAASPRPLYSSSMRISSLPYADEEMPSGDSTPSASGLDSRSSPSWSFTSGGPSSRRFSEYENVSGRSSPRLSNPAALRTATWFLPSLVGICPVQTLGAGSGDSC